MKKKIGIGEKILVLMIVMTLIKITEKFKDGLTNHQRDYQEKKQEYNPDGTAKDPCGYSLEL